MSADFIGLTVIVKLRSPPTTLQGLVGDVQGQRLTLRDVIFNSSGKRLAEYVVHGPEIDDIEVARSEPAETPVVATAIPPVTHPQQPVVSNVSSIVMRPIDTPAPPVHTVAHAPTPPYTAQSLLQTTQQPQKFRSRQYSSLLPAQIKPAKKTLIDPAIVSYERVPGMNQKNPRPVQVQQYVVQGQPPTIAPRDILPRPLVAAPTTLSIIPHETVLGGVSASHHIPDKQQHFDYLVIDNETHEEEEEEVIVQADDSSPDGWRKTPILIEKRNRKRGRRRVKQEPQNGWATEDATDVQEMGDFDFAANLSKFDKVTVFEQLREADTTADEDRLVSFNRIARPGTFGGNKLHPTEMVLGLSKTRSRDHTPGSIPTDDIDHNLTNLSAGSSRARLMKTSRSATDKNNKRKSLAFNGPSGTMPSVDDVALRHRARTGDHATFTPLQSDTDFGVLPLRDLPGGVGEGPNTVPNSRKSSTILPSKPTYRYAQSAGIVPVVSPETMAAIEELASVQLGFTEELLAENAGRGIAEVVLSAINPGGRRLQGGNHNPLPIVLFLCSETKTGARALAAARHLQERGVRVIATVPGPIDYTQGPLSTQLQRLGGKAIRNWQEISAHLKTLDAPPELIIDALSSSTSSPFAHSDPIHASTAVEMMGWANKSKASVLAIDRPSGIDAITGEVEVWEGEPAEVRAKVVVCLAAPTSGLLRAMELRHDEDNWRVSVVDVGLGGAGRLYVRALPAQERRGGWVSFGDRWVVGLRYDAGEV